MLLFFLMTLAVAAACPTTPHPCACSVEVGEIVYRCNINGLKFVVKSATNDYAKIQCQEGTLTCDNMPSIPVSHNGTLSSLKMSSCKLPRSLGCVVQRLGALDVERVTLDDARDELRAEHLEGIRKIKALMLLHAEMQTSVPFDALASFPDLSFLQVNGASIQLQNTTRTVLNNVLKMDLADNHIKEIPDGAFSAFPNLKELYLWGNDLTELGGGAFRGLDKLKFLDLTMNPLQELPAAFHLTPSLEELQLEFMSFALVRKAALSGHRNLAKVTIEDGYVDLTFENGSFSNLSSLQVVSIRTTPLTPLPSNLFKNSRSLKKLVMVSCSIQELPRLLFEDQENLKSLELNDNNIKKLYPDQFSTLKKLELLDLSRNNIRDLPEQVFDGLSHLFEVKLDHNQLVAIHQQTFLGPRYMRTLTLSHNNLTLLKNNRVEEVNISPFGDLVYLQQLDLSHNLLSVIFDDWRSLIHEIRRIDLSGNQITRLRKQDIEFRAKNLTIDLQQNYISGIEAGPNLHNYSTVNFQHAVFLLQDNPIVCNCHIYPFLDFIRRNTWPSFEVGSVKCASPAEYVNDTLKTIPLDSLTCNISKCPKGCTCLSRPANLTLELDCSETPALKEFPDPKECNMTSSKLKTKRFTNSVLPKHVVSLNLSKIDLFEVPILPAHLKEVDLRFNHLTYIPKTLLHKNYTLFLSGNLLQCSCGNWENINDLLYYKDSISDFKDIICDNQSYLSKIDVGHLCDVWLATIIGSTLATLGLLAAVVAALVYHYSKEIKIYIYGKGWNIFINEHEVDGKSFDVLVSYADSCEKLAVQKIVPILEDEGYSVCVRYRDWDIGDFIPGKVADLVEKSRRTIVLISKDYLTSMSAIELHAALMSERRDKRKRVLIIATKDLDPDPKLQEFLEWKKYMEFEDSAFWNNLRRKLPKRQEKVHKTSKLTRKALNVLLTSDGKVMFHSKKSLNNVPDTV